MFNENEDPVLEPVPERASDVRPRPMSETPGYAAEGQPRASMPDAPAYPRVSAYEDSDGPFVLNGKTPREHRSKKGLAIALGCLLLALLAAGGWWFLKNLPRKDPFASLKNSAENSMRSYMDYTKDLPNLHKYQENILAALQADGIHLDLNISLEGNVDAPMSNLQLTLDHNGKNGQSRLHASLDADGRDVPIDCYIDEDQIQLASSFILAEGETLALPVKDFGKKFNESPMGKLTGAELPDDFSLSFLTDGTSDRAMKDAFGSDWSDFMDSVSYRKAAAEDGEDPFTTDGETYVLVWDQTLLDKMSANAQAIVNSTRKNSEYDKLLPSARILFLQSLSQGLRSIRFRVADEMLIGVYLEIQDKNSKTASAMRIELVGEDNPCSRAVFFNYRQDAATGKMVLKSCGESTYTVADGKLIIKTVETKPDGSDPKTVLESVYNDADGRMTFKVMDDSMTSSADSPIPGVDMLNSALQGIDLRYIPTEDGMRMELGIDLSSFSVSGLAPVLGTMKLSCELSPKNDAVQPLSQRPTQILEMDVGSLQKLIMRIYQQVGIGSLPGSYK